MSQSGGKSTGQGKKKGEGSAARAGLVFPPSRTKRLMKRSPRPVKLSADAPVYLAAMLEYLVAEVLGIAGNLAIHEKKSRITPVHLKTAICNDEELHALLGNVTISGVVLSSDA